MFGSGLLGTLPLGEIEALADDYVNGRDASSLAFWAADWLTRNWGASYGF